MREHVSLVGPPVDVPRRGGSASSLPPDLLRQVRQRVRALALLMLAAFAVDPLIYFTGLVLDALHVVALPAEFHDKALFAWVSIGAALASGLLWRAAASLRIPPSRLLAVGFLYQLALCVTIAWMTYVQTWRAMGIIPNLTWVPAVIILFPLVLPASPIRTLVTSALSAAIPPLVLVVLNRAGEIMTDAETYPSAIISGAVAVGFAYMGSRVVYGLSRAVSAALELGSYRLEEKLGAGGMGEVWRASHRLLARPAALKSIRASSSNAAAAVAADAGSRFEREAQVIARLRSPHTVTLFDFGVADDGTFYYAMELLDGVDADKFVRRFGVMPPARVAHVLRQMCHSLSEADACGLVHRDVKPANVFLCRYGEDVDFVKVLDFGLVKAFGKDADTESALTREHVVAGTPAFMAPEQALGAASLDGRVDLYATGCVAYWLLTGTHVFEADTPMGLLLHHAQTPPAPPSTRTSQSIPAELERIVMSCLAKDPARRPQSARELSSWLAESRVGGGWNDDLARTWWERHLPRS